MPEVGVGTIPIRPDMAGFQRDVERNVDGALSSVSSRLQSFGRTAFSAGSRMSLAITAPVAAGFGAAFNAASDLNEAVNATTLIFRDQAGAMGDFARDSAQSLGLSESAARGLTTQLGGLLQNLGFSQSETVTWSKDLATLGADLGSAFNTEPSEAIEAIGSALRGETEPIRRFNVMLDDARVRQKAVEMGLAATTSEVDANGKAQATLALIMEQTAAVQGDFANTADGAANQQRILRAEFENAAAMIGQRLLPIGLDLLGWVQKAFDWFSKLSDPWQKILLVGGALLGVLGPIVTVVGALATVVGVLISPVGLVVVGIAALVGGLVYAYTHFEGFRDVVQSVIDFFTDSVMPIIKEVADYLVEQFGNAIDWVKEMWPQISEAVGHVMAVVEGVVRTILGIVLGIWREHGDTILDVVKTVFDFIKGTIENILGVIQGIIKFILGVINGEWGLAWEGIKQILSSMWDQMKNIVSTVFNSVKDVIGAVLGTIEDNWNRIWQEIASFLDGVWDGIKKAVETALSDVVEFFSGLAGRAIEAIGDFGEAIAELADDIYQGGRDLGRKLINGMVDMIKDVGGGLLRGALGVATGGLSGVIERVIGDGPGRQAAPRAVGGSTLARVRSIMPNGLYITSSYRSPEANRRAGGSPTSYHMDRNNPAVDIAGPTRLLDQFAATLRRIGGWRELLWRVPDHYDHIHVAHAGGYVTPDGIEPLRSDEVFAKLQVGETVLPAGTKAGVPDMAYWREAGRQQAEAYASTLRQVLRAA